MARPMPGWESVIPLGCFAGVFWLPAGINAADFFKGPVLPQQVERFDSTAKAMVFAWNTRHAEDWVPWMLWAKSEAEFERGMQSALAFSCLRDTQMVSPATLAALCANRDDRNAILFAAGLGAAKPAEAPAIAPPWACGSPSGL